MTTFEHMCQTIEQDGFTITARIEQDYDTTPPWEREDGHGEVSEWTSRDKKAGELTLTSERGSRRYYDFAGAVKLARRDGWGVSQAVIDANFPKRMFAVVSDGSVSWEFRHPNHSELTKRQIAALAAREDFERLRRWCNDDWSYVGVVVTVSARGVELGSASLWGIESDAGDYPVELANELLSEAMEEARNRIAEINAVLEG